MKIKHSNIGVTKARAGWIDPLGLRLEDVGDRANSGSARSARVRAVRYDCARRKSTDGA